MRKISSAAPSITPEEIRLVTEAVQFGWHENMSIHIDQFIDEFSGYVGLEYCLPTAHCTDAIHLALLSLGIGPGDEVIVPDLTWVASVSPILYVGATPVFADVDPISWCLTKESIESCITAKTKAVVVVDLLGNMPQWDEIIDLCRSKGLLIIEDAAEGIGAKFDGKLAGNFGDVSLFSFNATKLIMAGQGGAFCTNNSVLYEKAKLYSHHGIDKAQTNKYFWSTLLGFNYNWTNIQAALALAQLRRIDDLIDYKKWLYDSYSQRLSDISGLTLSAAFSNVEPTYWITCGVLDEGIGLCKEDLISIFAKELIDIRPMFYPVSSMPPFVEYKPKFVNAVAHSVSKYGFCLPSGNNLNEDDVDRVCEVLIGCLRGRN